MSTLVLPSRRRRALAATAALVGGLLAALPTQPAAAAPTGTVSAGTASWGLSTWLNSATPGRANPKPDSYVLPSSFNASTRLSTWGAATGSVAGNGSATLGFTGTVVNYASTSGAWLKLADVQATLDANGNGTVSALVSYRTAPGTQQTPGDPAYNDTIVTRGPTRIDIVTLAGNTAADRASTPTQTSWTGLDGAWTAAWVDFMDGDTATSVAPWTYQNWTLDATRTPQPFAFTVTTAAPSATAQVTGSSIAAGLTVSFSGAGFRAVTNPGDAGVYVGIAPSGGMPDVTTMAGQDAFAASQYASPGQIVDGAFSKTLNAPSAKLDPTKSYSVYTWQAHTHSNTSQDTETPLSIDYSTLFAPSTITPGGASTTSFGTPLVVTAAVSGPGTVALRGVGAAQTATVANGSVSFTIPGTVAAGTYNAVLAYSGGPGNAPSTASRAITVTKAGPVVSYKVLTKPTASTRGKLRVSAKGVGGATAPSGRVVLVLKRNGVKQKVQGTLVGGAVAVKLPRLAAGDWKLTVKYAGDANYAKGKLAKTLTVKA